MMIGDDQESDVVHSGGSNVAYHCKYELARQRAYIVDRDDQGPARRLHLQKACVNGIVLVNV